MRNLIHIFSLLLIIISCNIDEVYIDVFDPEQSRLDSLNQRLEDKNLIFSYFERNGILSYDTTQRGVRVLEAFFLLFLITVIFLFFQILKLLWESL